MLSMHDNEQYFFEALKAGASGYVLKSAPTATSSRRAARDARRAVPLPRRRDRAVRDYLERAGAGRPRPADPLTPRELEVIKLIAEGHTSDEIAERWSSARRPSSATARTCWRSSGCATASS